MFRTPFRTALRLGIAAPLIAVTAGTALTTTSAGPAAATTFTVDDPSDSAAMPHTLRWALAQANADVTAPVIEIAPGLAIDLTCLGGGALGYDNPANLPLTIVGNGATITQTCPAEAVLTSQAEDLDLRDLTVAGGGAGGVVAGHDIVLADAVVEGSTAGGGVTAYNGRATILRSSLRDNIGSAGGGVGAIHVTVDRSTLSGNRGANGGGAWADQTLTITNTTVSDNTATNSGGGLYAGLNQISMTYATIVANSAPAGANIDLDFSSTITSAANLIGSPLGGGENCQLAAGATVVSTGATVSSDTSCAFVGGPGDLEGTDPAVAPLAIDGGPTATRRPLPTSPAIDRADCALAGIGIDQRAVARPQSGACDAGAVEVPAPADGSTTTTTTAVAPAPEPGPATEAAAAATPVAARPRFTG